MDNMIIIMKYNDIYKFRKVGKSIKLNQCKNNSKIFIPFKNTSFRKIGMIAFSKERDKDESTSKKERNDTIKNTRWKFSFNKIKVDNSFGSVDCGFINSKKGCLKIIYKKHTKRNPIIGIKKEREINWSLFSTFGKNLIKVFGVPKQEKVEIIVEYATIIWRSPKCSGLVLNALGYKITVDVAPNNSPI